MMKSYLVIFFQLKISGSNLQNVCQKILRISRESKNERLFAEENVIGTYVIMLSLSVKRGITMSLVCNDVIIAS